MNQLNKSEDGHILLIDKALQWTSFDVVNKIRNIIKIKKVGHAGTLDPLATGLLIVCAGKMTKQINQFMDLEKSIQEPWFWVKPPHPLTWKRK